MTGRWSRFAGRPVLIGLPSTSCRCSRRIRKKDSLQRVQGWWQLAGPRGHSIFTQEEAYDVDDDLCSQGVGIMLWHRGADRGEELHQWQVSPTRHEQRSLERWCSSLAAAATKIVTMAKPADLDIEVASSIGLLGGIDPVPNSLSLRQCGRGVHVGKKQECADPAS